MVTKPPRTDSKTRVDTTITVYGYMLIYVSPADASRDAPAFYTVGLTDQNQPEVIAINDEDFYVNHRILTHLAELLVKRPDYLLPLYTTGEQHFTFEGMVIQLAELPYDDAAPYARQAVERYKQKQPKFVTVIYPT